MKTYHIDHLRRDGLQRWGPRRWSIGLPYFLREARPASSQEGYLCDCHHTANVNIGLVSLAWLRNMEALMEDTIARGDHDPIVPNRIDRGPVRIGNDSPEPYADEKIRSFYWGIGENWVETPKPVPSSI